VKAVFYDKNRSADLPHGQSGERVFQQSFHIHKALNATVSLVHPPGDRYNPGAQALVNGIAGSRLYNDGQWLGFSGDDLEAVIDLGDIFPIHSIGMNLLNYHWQKMWAPVSLQFLISVDGVHYKEIYAQRQFPLSGVNTVRHVFAEKEARWVKVKAENPGIIPAGEYGAGGKPLLMADEIIIE
jgi:hexosaminidase